MLRKLAISTFIALSALSATAPVQAQAVTEVEEVNTYHAQTYNQHVGDTALILMRYGDVVRDNGGFSDNNLLITGKQKGGYTTQTAISSKRVCDNPATEVYLLDMDTRHAVCVDVTTFKQSKPFKTINF